MSKRYAGGFVSATKPPSSVTSGPGVWSREEQGRRTAAGAWPPAVINYVEDVFSTWLYDGNSSTQTINNGIDLAGKGGLVWTKVRSTSLDHMLFDTTRGNDVKLSSNLSSAQSSGWSPYFSFGSSGYTLGAAGQLNASGGSYVGWTFRKQPKFFDVVTFTGNGSATNNISHSLGSVPGFIIVKRTDSTGNWCIAAGDSSGNYRQLGFDTAPSYVSTAKSNIADSTMFNVGYMGVNFDGSANVNGGSYVAYLFASNAGGFGLTGTDNVISCGSFTSGSSDTFVSLGYEPQLVLWKNYGASEPWRLFDNMRGVSTGGVDAQLQINYSSAEDRSYDFIDFNATGFTYKLAGGNPSQSMVYIAIRRGPMKAPTDGTKVFAPVLHPATGGQEFNAGFPPDLAIIGNRDGSAYQQNWLTRLCGGGDPYNTSSTANAKLLASPSTAAEVTNSYFYLGQKGLGVTTSWTTSDVLWSFRRAPGFFDEVCYTGSGTYPQVVKHNLGVQPELVILKGRNDSTYGWWVGAKPLGSYGSLYLNGTNAAGDLSYAVVFESTNATDLAVSNYSGVNYVAHLFATCPGVSKVGTFTANGTDQVINCGFASGARFIMYKQTNGVGGWYVYDSARGITGSPDPYLLMNSTASENSGYNVFDADASGFKIRGAIFNTGTFIYLAIA